MAATVIGLITGSAMTLVVGLLSLWLKGEMQVRTKTEIQEITDMCQRQIREEFFERLDGAIASAAYSGLQKVELGLPQCWEGFYNQLMTRYGELGFSVECSKKINCADYSDWPFVRVSWED